MLDASDLFWHVIDLSEEYREIGRGDNLFVQVQVQVCNTTQIKRLHDIVAASGKIQLFQLIFSFGFPAINK